jgi:hypothetical protein
MPTRYRDFIRHIHTLYMEAHAGWVISDHERKRLIASIEDTVTNADLKWPGTHPDGPKSIPGSEHLRDNIAHDWGLSEPDEVRFRRWWDYVMEHGFGPTPLHRERKTA